MIEGVKVKKLTMIPDERGRLMEILRSDDDLYSGFGQVYMTTTYPNVVKAWHLHKIQTDNIAVVKGMLKLVLFDSRESSSTLGALQELFVGDYNPLLVQIPPGVWHGWMCISESEAFVVNVPTEVYRPDAPDEYRTDPHDNDIPYRWARKDG